MRFAWWVGIITALLSMTATSEVADTISPALGSHARENPRRPKAEDDCVTALDARQETFLRYVDKITEPGSDFGRTAQEVARRIQYFPPEQQALTAALAMARLVRRGHTRRVWELYLAGEPRVRAALDELARHGARPGPNGELDLHHYNFNFASSPYDHLGLALFYPDADIAQIWNKTSREPVILGDTVVMPVVWHQEQLAKARKFEHNNASLRKPPPPSRVLSLQQYRERMQLLVSRVRNGIADVERFGNEAGYVLTQVANLIDNPGEASPSAKAADFSSDDVARSLLELEYFGYPKHKVRQLRDILSSNLLSNNEKMERGLKQVEMIASAIAVAPAAFPLLLAGGAGSTAAGVMFGVSMGFTAADIGVNATVDWLAGKGSFLCNLGKQAIEKGPGGFYDAVKSASLARAFGMGDKMVVGRKILEPTFEWAKVGAGGLSIVQGIHSVWSHLALYKKVLSDASEEEAMGHVDVARKLRAEAAQIAWAISRNAIGSALPFAVLARECRKGEQVSRQEALETLDEAEVLATNSLTTGATPWSEPLGLNTTYGVSDADHSGRPSLATYDFDETPEAESTRRMRLMAAHVLNSPALPASVRPSAPAEPEDPAQRELDDIRQRHQRFSRALATVIRTPSAPVLPPAFSVDSLPKSVRHEVDLLARRRKEADRREGRALLSEAEYRRNAARELAASVSAMEPVGEQKQVIDRLMAEGRELFRLEDLNQEIDPEVVAVGLRDQMRPRYDEARAEYLRLTREIAEARRRKRPTNELEETRAQSKAIIDEMAALQNSVSNIRLRKRLYELVQEGSIAIRSVRYADGDPDWNKSVPVVEVQLLKPFNDFVTATRRGSGPITHGYDFGTERKVPRGVAQFEVAADRRFFKRRLGLRVGTRLFLGADAEPSPERKQFPLEGDLSWRMPELRGSISLSGRVSVALQRPISLEDSVGVPKPLD